MEAVRLNKPFVSELPRRSVSGWTWLVGGVVGSLLILLAVYLVLHGGAL